MSDDEGKYDAEATAARESAQAGAVILIVLRGNRGDGFTVQIDTAKGPWSSKASAIDLGKMLHVIADKLERGELS